MKINLKKAIETFYPSPSFEQVYFEAIANSIDAKASEIKIAIALESYDQCDTLRITIKDNGHGFRDSDFEKFSSLMEAESNDHKGLGRLVYLAYFNEIVFDSFYDESKRRQFTFNSKFKGDCKKQDASAPSGTTIEYRYFSGKQVQSYAYLTPKKIKESILQHFFPLFFTKKESGESIKIIISLDVKTPNPSRDFVSGEVFLTLEDLPLLETTSVKNPSDFFQTIDIHYLVEKNLTKHRSITTSLCIDGRAVNSELISIESIPHGYQLVFLFASGSFIGKANHSRQRLELPDDITERTLRTTLRKEIGRIIALKIPSVVQNNQKTEADLNGQFPHLAGYYPKDEPGLMVRTTALDEAQKTFFNEQKRLLECETLDGDRYEKALELSARALMEYVLYRSRIIQKLRCIDPSSKEEDIHKLIVPMRKTLQSETLIEDVYNNNIWMLDDKFMSYTTVLSDRTMAEVVKHIALDEIKDEKRPDITIVFSGDPETSQGVDVVVVELKKHGVALANKEEVVSQLKQRARKLLRYYPNKIERIWFYGITDIDQEFRHSLKEDQFKELFSHGNMFYKLQPIIVEDENNPFYVDMFVMTYETFIKDAESRNLTFIRILKGRIAQFIGDGDEENTPAGTEDCQNVAIMTECLESPVDMDRQEIVDGAAN